MCSGDERYIAVTFIVAVHVDPKDDELLDRFESNGSFSISEVVRAEIESNLESVSYVRHVSVKPNRKEVSK
jgi:hypothetical protein